MGRRKVMGKGRNHGAIVQMINFFIRGTAGNRYQEGRGKWEGHGWGQQNAKGRGRPQRLPGL